MAMTTPIHITQLTRTCTACPSQWEGKTSDGAVVYLRYRWGEFYLHLGPTIGDSQSDEVFSAAVSEALNRDAIFVWHSDDDMDGWMDDQMLREILPPWITIDDAAIQQELTKAQLDHLAMVTAQRVGELFP